MAAKKNHIFEFKYPKFAILIGTFILAYWFFAGAELTSIHNYIQSTGYFGTLIAGTFYTYGFTGAFATAAFLILAKTQNVFFGAMVGGLGALIMDIVIFEFISVSFTDEVKKLSGERIIKKFNGHLPKKLRNYLLPVLGGLIIASPLPDEFGVALLAMSSLMSVKKLIPISFVMNTLGILAIMLIGKLI